ncbi:MULTISPECIES: hypothetical protein [unclassified Haloferax]|jgi:hypothetical protein|uniref:hypothetical protein n=1 Tax=unclassified Haloferax TaxID=2625095 RepID=UPI002875B217|nr:MULTISPECIES: hypothetical protein [unclassified Haloferax]MDS0243051.1 hypothetical protein [Haloferax sp. S2CR25]MDS0446172.1 hypothetical protein [Haloferax sp. S2CR25-2]
MASKARSAGILVALAVLLLAATGPAVAQDGSYSGTGEAEGIMDRLHEVIFDLLLLRGGVIVMGIGAVLWFTAKNSADRAQWGRWLAIGGVSMMGFSIGVKAVMGVIRFIFGG